MNVKEIRLNDTKEFISGPFFWSMIVRFIINFRTSNNIDNANL